MSISPPSSSPQPIRSTAGPDPLDLVLIIMGILAGLMLSPNVLGQFLPEIYDRFFLGSVDAQVQSKIFDQVTEQHLKQMQDRLQATGVTEAAIAEAIVELVAQRNAGAKSHGDAIIVAQAQRLAFLRDRLTALVLATLAIMILETVLAPGGVGSVRANRMLRRLATVRYALMAVWVALILAQPDMLGSLPIVFVALLVAVGLVAALVPLTPTRTGAS